MADASDELKAMTAAHEALRGLDEDQLPRVLNWLTDALGMPRNAQVAPAVTPSPAQPSAVATGHQSTAIQLTSLTPKEFVREKKPKSGAERIACLAYYLSEVRGTPHFKTPDIVTLNTEAALPKIGNPTRDVDNAERGSGYLASAGNGNKQLSSRGEALVLALPDREAVATALDEHPFARRKASKSASKKAATKPAKKASAKKAASGKLPKP